MFPEVRAPAYLIKSYIIFSSCWQHNLSLTSPRLTNAVLEVQHHHNGVKYVPLAYQRASSGENTDIKGWENGISCYCGKYFINSNQ